MVGVLLVIGGRRLEGLMIVENAVADDNDDARDVNGSMKIRKMTLIVCVFDDPLCISL